MKKQISAAMMIFAMIAAPVTAQELDKRAFEAQVFDVQADKPLQLAELSKQEMKETEGAAGPLVVGLGYLAKSGTFVATRYATPRVAANLLRNGSYQAAHVARANQAKSLAAQVHGRNNILRHGPSGHVNKPVNYSHFQAAKPNPNLSSSRAHVFYGRQLTKNPKFK